MNRRIIRTVCPRNCYCTCGMLATVEDDRLVENRGGPRKPGHGGGGLFERALLCGAGRPSGSYYLPPAPESKRATSSR